MLANSHTTPRTPILAVTALLQEPLRSLLVPVEPAIQKLLWLDRLERLYLGDPAGFDEPSPDMLLRSLDVTFSVADEDLAAIPRSGPAIVVANHPFGLLDGAILASLLARVRPDGRILANSMLATVPGLRDRCIFVDPFGRSEAVGGNARALKRSLAWLRSGGLLAVFPSGEVAHMDWRRRAVVDPPWNAAVARLAQICSAPVVPLHFSGGNSIAFQVAGAVHPALRTASLPRELLNKRGSRVQVRVGKPVETRVLRSFPRPADAVAYLRLRTDLLAQAPHRVGAAKAVQPIAAPQSSDRLAQEIAGLASERRLCESGALAVYLARADEAPAVVTEIGRLREIAFRAVGEGTGRALDLDRFDRHYQHLVLWNRQTEEVAGAYRLGATPDILPRFGVKGLYTNSLFRYDPKLFDAIGPAVELGRSFVRPEYQKQYAPLLLLWKGIGRYVASRPECGVLFGGVSISSSYQALSRHLMVRFLQENRMDGLARFVKPRRPYRPAVIAGAAPQAPPELEALSGIVSDLEPDGKGVPILVRQYLRTGGRMLGFNVDPKFADALDALVLVDLRNAPDEILDRYLGGSGAAAFRACLRTA